MIYVRRIFKQDLRVGKQIAFPKEPSNDFFNFNYTNPDPERINPSILILSINADKDIHDPIL